MATLRSRISGQSESDLKAAEVTARTVPAASIPESRTDEISEEPQLEVSPETVAELLKEGGLKILDVRTPEEYAIVSIADSALVDPDLAKDIIETWPKNTPIVTVCHHGIRSLGAAAYLREHGFSNVRSMKGGIEAWAIRVDSSLARY